MTRYVVFAASQNVARVDVIRPSGLNPRQFTVITGQNDLQRLWGRRAMTAIFTERWWANWPLHEAMEAWCLQYYSYADRRWERIDRQRRDFARGQVGLPPTTEPTYEEFDPAQDPEPIQGRANWARIEELRSKGGSLLPGLHDKKRTIQPFWDYPSPTIEAIWKPEIDRTAALLGDLMIYFNCGPDARASDFLLRA